MPTKETGRFALRPCRLAIRQFAAPPAKRYAEIVVEVEIHHPIQTFIADEVPDDAPVPTEVRGDVFDDLTLPAQLSSRVRQVMRADNRRAFRELYH